MGLLRKSILIFSMLPFKAHGKDLGVYLPQIFETRDLQDALQKDPILGKYEIQIFQKLEDFQIASSSKKFDVAILPSSYEQFNKDYKPVMRLRGDEEKLNYIVVSFKKNLPEGFSVAVIDEVGRKNLKKWLSSICSVCGKQKDVKKAKDLYSMLALGSTDSILTSPLNLQQIKEESGTELFVVHKGEDQEYPAIFVPAEKESTPSMFSGVSSKTFAPLRLKVGGDAK